MSYQVTVVAKSPEELQQKIESLLSKGIFAKTFTGAHGNAPLTIVPETEDEYEDVPSQYGLGPGESLHPANTIVDNEVDSEGVPWDNRIHASTKTRVKSGAWKLRKGVDDSVINQVKHELRSRVANSSPAPTYQAPTQYVSPEVVSHSAPSLPQTQTQVIPTLPSMQQPPMLQTGHTLESFKANFAQTMSALITHGKLTQEYVNSLKGHFGIAEIWMANAPQQEACFNEFVSCGVIQRVG